MDKVFDRRTLIGGLGYGIAGTAAGSASAAPAPGAAVCFAVLGDWGRDTPAQYQVARRLGEAMAANQGRFVLAVGDNFYESGVSSVEDPLWRARFEDVYTHPALQVPWHVALGNHDYGGVPQAQVDYTALSSRWSLPARYYKVEDTYLRAVDVDMFVLDTSPFVDSYRRDTESVLGRNSAAQDPAAQMAWLDRALGASQARMKLVAGHHTIHSGGGVHGDTAEMVAQVKPILLRHGVTAYIGGHDHDLQHIVRDGMSFIQSGGGMEARPVQAIEGTRFCRATPGFAMATVSGDRLDLQFLDHQGTVLYRASIPALAAVA
jgi:acid phosphatase